MLITHNFEPTCVRQACYELRASNIVYETASERENKRLEIGQSGYVLRPHTYVTVIVMESIDLDARVLARIMTKGQLFALGILPVNTYADPGFKGRLGITLYNASHRALVIRPEQAIAKIEFTLLAEPVGKPYSGQHGYETEIWPIPTQFYATSEDIKAARVEEHSLAEISRSWGPVVANIEGRLRHYERKVWLQILVMLLGFVALFALYGQLGFVQSVSLGIVANLLTTWGLNALSGRQAAAELSRGNGLAAIRS